MYLFFDMNLELVGPNKNTVITIEGEIFMCNFPHIVLFLFLSFSFPFQFPL